MIKAFKIGDKTYTSNGDVVIAATKAKVKNSDNGEFSLDLVCPEKYSKYVKASNIIVCPTPQGEQPFRIWNVKQGRKSIEAKCLHVYHDSGNLIIPDNYVENRTCEYALTYFNEHLDSESPFTVHSDVTGTNSLRCERETFEDCIESILERWGGHLVRDKWNISIKADISRDNGINIEYGKNLQDLTATYDWTNVCTKLLPVGKDGQLLDSLYVNAPVSYEIPFTKTVSFSQDIDQEDYPTEEAYIAALKADLLAQATKYVNAYCKPSVNYTIKCRPEKVSDIGDIIRVKDRVLGVDITTQVIAYEYDAISGKYSSLEFGNNKVTVKTAIEDLIKKS